MAGEAPERRRRPTGEDYQPAPGQDATADVLTLVGANGEPGLALPREEWESWPVVTD